MSAEDIAEEIESFVRFRHEQGSRGPEARKQAIAVYLQMRFGAEAASTFNEPRPEDWYYFAAERAAEVDDSIVQSSRAAYESGDYATSEDLLGDIRSRAGNPKDQIEQLIRAIDEIQPGIDKIMRERRSWFGVPSYHEQAICGAKEHWRAICISACRILGEDIPHELYVLKQRLGAKLASFEACVVELTGSRGERNG